MEPATAPQFIVAKHTGQELHRWVPSPHTRSVTDAEGGLVLNIKTGRFHSLNATGAVVWEAIRQNPNGSDSAQIGQAMTAVFGSHPRMADDLKNLLRTFEQNRLVQRRLHSDDVRKEGALDRRQVPPRTVSKKERRAIAMTPADFSVPAEFTKGTDWGSRTVAAWLCFLAVYLIIAIGGFPRLHQALRWLSANRRAGAPSKEKILNVCVSVNKAATYYLRQSWCLHRAATAFILLRLGGMPAELVIGCQRVPFYSHAWVEIHGTVVNDTPEVKALYPELDRI